MKVSTSTILRSALIVMVIMVNIGCDQVSKHMVRQHISYDQNISLLYNHFTLTKVENTGAFLSLGDNIPTAIKFVLLTLLPLLVLAVALIWLIGKRNMPRIPLIAACFMIGGGIGNIYDRLLYHSVTDFMYIHLFGFVQTGIFNMADVSVTIGVIMILVWYYVISKKTQPTVA